MTFPAILDAYEVYERPKWSVLRLWLFQKEKVRGVSSERSSSAEIWNTVEVPEQKGGSPIMENHYWPSN